MCRTTSAVCLQLPVLPETSIVKTATTTKKNLVEILNTSLDEKHMNLGKYSVVLETIKKKIQ